MSTGIDTADHVLQRPSGMQWVLVYEPRIIQEPRLYKGSELYHRDMLAERARFEAQAQAERGERV